MWSMMSRELSIWGSPRMGEVLHHTGTTAISETRPWLRFTGGEHELRYPVFVE